MSLRRSGLLMIAAVATSLGTARAQQGDPPPVNLAARYNLVERFTTQESKPGYVGQYLVAFDEIMSSSERAGFKRNIKFSERPASVSDDRRPTEIVRHYDSHKVTPPLNDKGDRRPLDDLTIWCREVPGKPPLVISLTPGRSLHEKEFEFARTNNYVSKLTLVLPSSPVRLADTWRVSPAGTFALTNLPDLVDGALIATLKEVRPHPSGTGQQAIITVTGRLLQDPDRAGPNDTTFNGKLIFAFSPTTPPGGGENNVIDGFGQIEKLTLAQLTTPAPGTKTPWVKRELVLERRFPGTDPLLAIPEPPPTPTVENSWLMATVPGGEFNVRHPQEYEVRPGPQRPKADQITPSLRLEAPDPGGSIFVITFDFYKTTIRPEAVFEELKAEWTQKKIDVIPGRTHRLPETDWPGLAVHHMEVGLKLPELGPDQPAVRRYSDYYVIQFTRAGSVVVSANTFSENHDEFRKKVEAILKTLKLGPPQA